MHYKQVILLNLMITWFLAQTLDWCHVHSHQQQLGKVPKLGKWVHYDSTEANRKEKVDTCTSLHFCKNILASFDRLMTGDEKWIFYKNTE